MAKSEIINEKEELREQAGMAMTDGNAILGELESEMPKKEVSQEDIDKNPIQYKYEVRLKKLPRKLKSVIGLKVGKVGRVVEVLDAKTVMVDFWDTRPAKIPIRNSYVEVTKTRKEVEIAAGTYVEEITPVPKSIEASLKFDIGKPRLDLIRPEFMLEMGKGLEYGSRKYSEDRGNLPNYLRGKGFFYSKVFASSLRHLYAWFGGTSIDKESGVHHLALVAVNVMFLFSYDTSKEGVDDRVFLGGKDENKDSTKK